VLGSSPFQDQGSNQQREAEPEQSEGLGERERSEYEKTSALNRASGWRWRQPPSLHLSIYLSIHLSIYMYVYLYVSLFPSISLCPSFPLPPSSSSLSLCFSSFPSSSFHCKKNCLVRGAGRHRVTTLPLLTYRSVDQEGNDEPLDHHERVRPLQNLCQPLGEGYLPSGPLLLLVSSSPVLVLSSANI
jgi:hypothetical protein